jgi:zinc transport system ATP-binding protein
MTAATNEVLAAEDLCVELDGLPVLRGVSLRLYAGETVALLGGNGSGKTTLVRSLVGLIPAQRGAVSAFGTPLRSFSDWGRIGYVPQKSTTSLSGAKVKEVVASGRLARRIPFRPPTRKDRQAVLAALAAVGMQNRAADELSHLSGGQQQRVLIARALAGGPDLLVLDEPTAGVDLEHQQVLAALLTRLVQSGVAVLVVLHEIGALAPLIDRAIVLRDGRVVHDGALGVLADGHRPHPGHEHEYRARAQAIIDGAVER